MLRFGRTILTVLGLAVGVALVIVISALTRGLDRAQATALDPLATIGTDLTVTRNAEEAGGVGFGPSGGRELLMANRAVLTDLSKLGKPDASSGTEPGPNPSRARANRRASRAA